ncbi:M48 family metallopeptidase [Acidovorax radicis]|uniref:M48 family metallopeptidase n=1 Tax=Acidovorax radicis TaxID=758826 RepID=UPI000237630D|nr:SprT family zinc-dependent metalloprotease [Acidovorax radicis]
MQRLVQLALDLFDPPLSPVVAPAAAPVVNAADFKQKMPPALDEQALVAPKTIVNRPAAPAVPLPSLLSPAEFRHPQASREVLLGDAVVAYALTRARRRTIGFTVGADGLAVRAPSWVTLGAVDAALREKSDWILRKLSDARERQQRLEGGRIVWANGAVLPYLGEPLTVVLDPSHGFAGKGGALVVAAEPGGAAMPTLQIGLPHSANPVQIRDAVQAWLMRDARRHFTARLDHFAPLLGVRWASLRLSSAQTRWGSAKADGSIRLNWRLLHYRPAVIDYVVAHELAHLRVMDHSPRFWDTVATVVPDYAQLRSRLRDESAPLWD